MSAIAATRRAPLLTAYATLVFAFIYLPIVVLIAYSFNRDGVGGFPPRHFLPFTGINNSSPTAQSGKQW
jgi:ABC-type spermidine/putrescine transport system permease subunit II